jgi:thioredoxin reductase (NADPH)
MDKSEIENIVILGSGPAGLTAGIYAARSNLKPILLAGDTPGGQLTITTSVENFPGFENGIMGPELMAVMQKQAINVGVNLINESAISVNLKEYPFKVETQSKTYLTHSIIISTGASAKFLNVPGENELMGKGVSGCATCDGAFFREKEILVVGGGDTAMEEALFLTKFASKVTIVHRRDSFRASSIMQKRVLENKKIEILFNSEIKKINGDNKVDSALIFDNKGTKEYELKTDGVFIAIGHIPNTTIFKDQLDLDENNLIIPNNITHTSIEGVFAAGDVSDPKYKQAISSAGIGCIAAIDALHFLEDKQLL